MKHTNLLILIVALGTGCAKEGSGYTRWGGHKSSYQLHNEQIHLDTLAPDQDSPEGYVSSTGLITATAAVGLALDQIETHLNKEAARYSQQYSGSIFCDGGTRNFTLTRTVTPDGGREPELAAKYEFALVSRLTLGTPSESELKDYFEKGKPIPPKLYEVLLKSVHIKYSKAKVAWPTDEIDIDCAVAIDGTWLAQGTLQRHSLLTGGSTSVRGYSLSANAESNENTPQTVGFVYIPSGDNVKDLILHISVVISERDSSRSSRYYLDGAELLRNNRESILSPLE